MNNHYDAVIVGAGIAGCLTALILGSQGHRVLLLERGDISLNGAEIIKPNAIRILNKYGISNELLNHGALHRTAIHYHHDGECILKHRYDTETETGYFLISPYADLISIIINHLSNYPNVEICNHTEILATRFSDNEIESLLLTSGLSVSGRVYVAADGRGSYLRKQLGISAEDKSCNLDIYMGTVAGSPLLDECNMLYISSTRKLAYFYPLTKSQTRIAFMFEPSEGKRLIEAGTASMIAHLSNFAPEFSDVLHQVEDISSFHRFPTYHMRASQYTKGNCVLIGNAALNVHPMTGQGMNSAIEDADFLSRQLNSYFRGLCSLDAALTQYSNLHTSRHDKLYKYSKNLVNHFHDKNKYLDSFDSTLHGSEF